MSGRTQFRCPEGCCICGTKSSSSRFTSCTRFSTSFGECFGAAAVNRSGELCNACVLAVKRWNKMPVEKRQSGLFHEVVDSKKGPGPKHMKQINKRQRRREARSSKASDSVSGSSGACSLIGSHSSTSSNNQIRAGGSSSGCGMSSESLVGLASCGSPLSINGVIPLAASTPSCGSSGSVSAGGSSSGGVQFRIPYAASVGSRRHYNRRAKSFPIRMPNNEEEVNKLLREIMTSNSEACNFDSREMHMAVRNHLRLRSRTVATLSTDHHSVSSGSFGSSVGNVDNLRN